MTPEARLRARLDRVLSSLHLAYSGIAEPLVEVGGPGPADAAQAEWARRLFAAGLSAQSVAEWGYSTSGGRFAGRPGELLALVTGDADELVSATAEQLEAAVNNLVQAKRRSAVLARSELTDAWPWHGRAARALEVLLRALAHPPEPARGRPGVAAPVDVARWLIERRALPPGLDAEEALRLAEVGTMLGTLSCPAAGVAAVYVAERDVDKGQRRPTIAIDATKTHHALVAAWGSVPQDRQRGRAAARDLDTFRAADGKLMLRLAASGSVQLAMPFDGSLSEQLVSLLRQEMGPMGLRHWCALHRLFTAAGRTGRALWTLDAHMDALGVVDRSREVRANIARDVEHLVTTLRIVRDKGAGRTVEAPLFALTTAPRVRDGGALEGAEIEVSPLVYAGVRERDGKLGRSYWWGPAELAHLDGPAVALGLVLSIRLRWDEGRPLRLGRRALLETAGIEVRPAAGRPGKARQRALEQLHRALDELRRIDAIGGWACQDAPADWWGGMYEVSPAAWQLDRWEHGLVPDERPPVAVPVTGSELVAWRGERGWSQRKTADELGLDHRVVMRAETKPPDEHLPKRLAAALAAWARR